MPFPLYVWVMQVGTDTLRKFRTDNSSDRARWRPASSVTQTLTLKELRAASDNYNYKVIRCGRGVYTLAYPQRARLAQLAAARRPSRPMPEAVATVCETSYATSPTRQYDAIPDYEVVRWPNSNRVTWDDTSTNTESVVPQPPLNFTQADRRRLDALWRGAGPPR